MDDIMGDFLGTSNMTDAEREAKSQELLREIDVDHIIVDGKVYLGAERLSGVLETFSTMLGLRAVLLKDASSLSAAKGVETVREVLGELNSEFLRREAVRLYDF